MFAKAARTPPPAAQPDSAAAGLSGEVPTPHLSGRFGAMLMQSPPSAGVAAPHAAAAPAQRARKQLFAAAVAEPAGAAGPAAVDSSSSGGSGGLGAPNGGRADSGASAGAGAAAATAALQSLGEAPESWPCGGPVSVAAGAGNHAALGSSEAASPSKRLAAQQMKPRRKATRSRLPRPERREDSNDGSDIEITLSPEAGRPPAAVGRAAGAAAAAAAEAALQQPAGSHSAIDLTTPQRPVDVVDLMEST